jgi:hypothetical protein
LWHLTPLLESLALCFFLPSTVLSSIFFFPDVNFYQHIFLLW